jgi:hypothetical protein
MKVYQLIQALQQYRGMAEVRIASQPSLPVEVEIDSLASQRWIDKRGHVDEVVFLVEGEQLGELAPALAVDIGWVDIEGASDEEAAS